MLYSRHLTNNLDPMKRIFSLFALSAMALTIFTQSAFAATLEAGEFVIINEPQIDDLYIATGRVEINEDVAGDVYLAAGDAVINGNIEEDLVIAGGQVSIIGDVGGDVRVLGGEVELFGNVGDDFAIVSGTAEIGPDSKIGGSILSASGLVTVSGEVGENIQGAVGTININGVVKQDVIITVQERIIVDHLAQIDGDLKYSSLIEANLPDGVVGGEVVFNKFDDQELLAEITQAYLIQRGFSFAGALLILIILVFAAPKVLTKSALKAREHVWKSMGIGAAALALSIFVAILLMATIIGIPLAMLLLMALGIVLILAKLFVASYLASFIMDFEKKGKHKKVSKWKLLAATTLTLLVYYLVGIIPVLGWIINFLLFCIGIGSMLQMEMLYLKFLREKKKI